MALTTGTFGKRLQGNVRGPPRDAIGRRLHTHPLCLQASLASATSARSRPRWRGKHLLHCTRACPGNRRADIASSLHCQRWAAAATSTCLLNWPPRRLALTHAAVLSLATGTGVAQSPRRSSMMCTTPSRSTHGCFSRTTASPALDWTVLCTTRFWMPPSSWGLLPRASRCLTAYAITPPTPGRPCMTGAVHVSPCAAT
jgi:hypothetical protein